SSSHRIGFTIAFISSADTSTSSIFSSFVARRTALYFTLFVTPRLAPTSTLFPYTTLFRSYYDSMVAKLITYGETREDAIRKMKRDRKSTRLNSSHVSTSYVVFCLRKKHRYRATRHLMGYCSSQQGRNGISSRCCNARSFQC